MSETPVAGLCPLNLALDAKGAVEAGQARHRRLGLLRDLRRRDLRPELMDQPGLSLEYHAAALRGLARVNRLSRTGASVWKAIRRTFPTLGASISVLDVAAGGGDVGIDLVRRAARGGCSVQYTGLDISPTAVTLARRRADATVCPAGSRWEFLQYDVFNLAPRRKFDVVACTLFLHHLDQRMAGELLGRMADMSRRLVVVNDLVRSTPGYWAAKVICRLISRNKIVHIDGPQSVAAAFRRDEVRRLAEQSGLHAAQIRRVWPFRFLLTWEHRA